MPVFVPILNFAMPFAKFSSPITSCATSAMPAFEERLRISLSDMFMVAMRPSSSPTRSSPTLTLPGTENVEPGVTSPLSMPMAAVSTLKIEPGS